MTVIRRPTHRCDVWWASLAHHYSSCTAPLNPLTYVLSLCIRNVATVCICLSAK